MYKKKLDEAQHNAGRWKSEYYQMREQLYQQQAGRSLWKQLPALFTGCVIGLVIKSPPVKEAASWLLARIQQVSPWSAGKKELQRSTQSSHVEGHTAAVTSEGSFKGQATEDAAALSSEAGFKGQATEGSARASPNNATSAEAGSTSSALDAAPDRIPDGLAGGVPGGSGSTGDLG